MAGATPSFIASQMGHEDARMVCEVYSTWIGDINQDQVSLRNNQMPTALLPRTGPDEKSHLISLCWFQLT